MSLGICAVCGYEKGIGECELCTLRSRISELEKLLRVAYEGNDLRGNRIIELEQENATLIAMQAWYEGEVERLREMVGGMTNEKVHPVVNEGDE